MLLTLTDRHLAYLHCTCWAFDRDKLNTWQGGMEMIYDSIKDYQHPKSSSPSAERKNFLYDLSLAWMYMYFTKEYHKLSAFMQLPPFPHFVPGCRELLSVVATACVLTSRKSVHRSN